MAEVIEYRDIISNLHKVKIAGLNNGFKTKTQARCNAVDKCLDGISYFVEQNHLSESQRQRISALIYEVMKEDID